MFSLCVDQEEMIFQVVKKNKWLYSYTAAAAKAVSTLRFLIVPSSWIHVIILGLVLSVPHKQQSIFLNFCPEPQGPTKNKIHRIAGSERMCPCLVQNLGSGEGRLCPQPLCPHYAYGHLHVCAHTPTHSRTMYFLQDLRKEHNYRSSNSFHYIMPGLYCRDEVAAHTDWKATGSP